MHKNIILVLILVLFSCEKNNTNDILPNTSVNLIIDLNLPQYINLQTPTGWAKTNGGLRGILILNTGLTPLYKAYDLACPNNDCSSAMEFDGSLKMKCPCDASEYSIIDGSPQTSGNLYFAKEYRVQQINPSTINITNF
jgi:nitrite reductase/ring-hydroxylating ferredoxin subunit